LEALRQFATHPRWFDPVRFRQFQIELRLAAAEPCRLTLPFPV